MGEPTTEASGRFGGARRKVVVSEPCRETRGRSAQNLGGLPVGGSGVYGLRESRKKER